MRPKTSLQKYFFSDNENVHNFNKDQFKYLLTLATKESYFMSTCHPKKKFTFEKEQNKCFNFLDVNVFRENNVSTTSVDRKLPVRCVYTRFDSYMSLNYKFSLQFLLLFFEVLPHPVTCVISFKKFVKLNIFINNGYN